MGLQVDDEETYRRYREAMTPILARYGGKFRYDFWLGETLISETDKPMNRVFVIHLPDRKSNDDFFADAEYQAVRKQFFDPSVSAVTRIAEIEL